MSSSRRLLQGNHRARGRPSASSSSSSSTQQARAAAAASSSAPPELPEYEPPSCPLDATSRRALAELTNSHDARKYTEHLGSAVKHLQSSVRDVNDTFLERRGQLRALQQKRRAEEEKTPLERSVEKDVARLRDAVPGLSTRCDAAVREVVDWQVELQDGQGALNETRQKVEEESASAAPRRRGDDEEGDDEDEDAMPDFTGPLRLLAEARDKLTADYASKTPYERYGLNNDYVHFKKLWHDAEHGEDGRPLPDATRWFQADGGADDAAADDDEDLIVAEEVLDLRCPLSMQVMTEPYTSKQCRHTFDKASIYEFLGSHPNKSAQCPQTGCSKVLTKKDLFLDEIMLRRIKRAQESQMKADSDDDEDEDGDEHGEANGDVSMMVTRESPVKSERTRVRGKRRIAETIDNEDEDD